MNVESYKLAIKQADLDLTSPYSEDSRRRLQNDQLKSYERDLKNLLLLVQSCLDLYLLPELIGLVKIYISLIDHQSLIVLRYISSSNVFTGGAIWYPLKHSKMSDHDEYATIDGQELLLPKRADHRLQILMYHRLSPRFQFIQQTVRGWCNIAHDAAFPIDDASGATLSWIYFGLTRDTPQLTVHSVFIPRSIHTKLPFDDQPFWTIS